MPRGIEHLAEDLTRAIRGEVRFDDASRALYATDASNYRQVPIGVIYPTSAEDVEKAVAVCRSHEVPILSRGAGTSLAGQTCNVAVVFDFSKHMNRILELDPTARTAWVEPGVILDHLRGEAEKYGLTFGPDPATHSRCTLGGMIGNNSCGVHALMGGKTVDNVEELEILTYDGLRMTVGRTTPETLDAARAAGGRRSEIYAGLSALITQQADRVRQRFPRIPRRVSGYNLDELLSENGFHLARALVGSEGTCVIVLRAKLKLIHNPAHRQLVVLGYSDIYQAAEAVPAILATRPIGLEGMDRDMVSNLGRYEGFKEKIRLLPQGEAWLLVEYGADSEADAVHRAEALLGPVVKTHHVDSTRPLPDSGSQARALWAIRESVLAATAFVPGQRDRHEGWEDSAVPPEKLAAYLRELRALYNRYGYHGAFYGHFGDGCLHTRIDFDLESDAGRQATQRFLNEAADLVVRYGGSLSGEHGDGQARAALLPKMFGPELVEAFRQFKKIWDPKNRMNPGKVVDAFGPLDNLRHLNDTPPHPSPLPLTTRAREDQHPPRSFEKTHFTYAKTENSFTRAVLRCVGVGKCRNEEGGLMCPSYQATRDEMHSTRGRAHLLFEMLKGETITEGWKSEEVREALDLCLSCKGCKTECPTNVDMATWKAEFLSHYYEGRLRPLKAYLFGLAPQWLRLGSKWPAAANAAARLFDKNSPRISPHTFRSRLLNRRAQQGGKKILLWPDTFTNYLNPEIGLAAVDVLESQGFSVTLPPDGLCCGRPLYDWGWLDRAKAQLQRILNTLRPAIEAGTPIVGLEPGCLSVFRDELLNFFPDDPAAQKLSRQTFLLAEFLQPLPLQREVGRDFSAGNPPSPPFLKGGKLSAILQLHCHHRSVMDAAAETNLLKSLGLQVSVPESGCCGMAGAFGLEKEHQAISTTLAERALAPAVRAAAAQDLIIADGFSCREQIRRTTGRHALHSAEVLRDRLRTQGRA